MNYIVYNSNIKVDSDKKWLKRNNYSKDAIKVYGELAKVKPPYNLADNYMATNLRMSQTRYKEAKRELTFCGLIEVYRLSPTTMQYLVGQYEIGEYQSDGLEPLLLTTTPYLEGRPVKLVVKDSGLEVMAGIDVVPTAEDKRMAKLVLGYVKEEAENTPHKPTDIEELKKRIPVPEPINLKEEDIL